MTSADVLVLSAPLVCRQKPFPDAVQSLNVLSDIAEAGSKGSCTMVITAPESQKVRLEIHMLQLENNYDFLQVKIYVLPPTND